MHMEPPHALSCAHHHQMDKNNNHILTRWLVLRFRVGTGAVEMMGGGACAVLAPYIDSVPHRNGAGWVGGGACAVLLPCIDSVSPRNCPALIRLRLDKPGRCRCIAHTADTSAQVDFTKSTSSKGDTILAKRKNISISQHEHSRLPCKNI